MGRSFFQLLKREDGVVAVVFAVMAIPFIAMAGWAVDYLRIQHVRDFLQVQVDAAALDATYNTDPDALGWEEAQWARVHAAARAELARTYQGNWARDVVFEYDWIVPSSQVQVTASAQVPLAFIKILPGVPDVQPIQVSAVAQVNNVVKDYTLKVSELDYDAGDYNRVWAYCYWRNRPNDDPDLPKRTQMVPIADNGGPSESQRNVYRRDEGDAFRFSGSRDIEDAALARELEVIRVNLPLGLDSRERGLWRQTAGGTSNWREYVYVAPMCTGDSELSFRLENVRFSRTQPRYWEDEFGQGMNWDGHSRWDFAPSNYRHKGRFNYYTDTYYEAGVPGEQYDGLKLPSVGNQISQPGAPANILETILCDTEEQCTTTNNGGIIPYRQSNREPMRATESCQEGKFMYYGFEDRPPGLGGPARDWQDIGWTDSDYDDIRIVIQCPVTRTIGDRNARLIR